MFCWIPPPISRFSGSLSQILTCWGFLEMTCKNIIRWFKQRNTLSHLFQESSFLMELSLQNFCRTFSLSLWASSRWRPSCSSCLDPVQVCNNRIIKTKLKQQKNLILLLFHFVFNITCSAAGAGFRHFFSCSLLELLVRVWAGLGFLLEEMTCKKTNYLWNWIEWKFRQKRAKNGRLWNWIEWKFQ